MLCQLMRALPLTTLRIDYKILMFAPLPRSIIVSDESIADASGRTGEDATDRIGLEKPAHLGRMGTRPNRRLQDGE